MLLLAMLMQVGAAQGAPVYLKCSLNARSGATVFNLQLNETSNLVTYSFTVNGITRTVTKPASFTADRVSFNSFSVSRTDLSFERDNRQDAFYGIADMSAVDHGQCQINTAKRAF